MDVIRTEKDPFRYLADKRLVSAHLVQDEDTGQWTLNVSIQLDGYEMDAEDLSKDIVINVCKFLTPENAKIIEPLVKGIQAPEESGDPG